MRVPFCSMRHRIVFTVFVVPSPPRLLATPSLPAVPAITAGTVGCVIVLGSHFGPCRRRRGLDRRRDARRTRGRERALLSEVDRYYSIIIRIQINALSVSYCVDSGFNALRFR